VYFLDDGSASVSEKITMVSAIPSAVSSVQSMHQAPAHKVLLLGSGFVAKPCLDFLSKEGIQVTVACRTLESAKKLSAGVKLAAPISLDVADEPALDTEVAKHDLVIRFYQL
jgi:glutamyl-tRNA reductase